MTASEKIDEMEKMFPAPDEMTVMEREIRIRNAKIARANALAASQWPRTGKAVK